MVRFWARQGSCLKVHKRRAGGGAQAGDQAPAVYVPQMGDSVVYLRAGHKEYLDSTRDKRRPPWQLVLSQVRCGGQLASSMWFICVPAPQLRQLRPELRM